MQVTQCDNRVCGKLGPVPPVGWIVLGEIAEPGPVTIAALMGRERTAAEGAFCSWACVVEFAYLKAVEASMAVADEPAAPEAGETP